MATVKSGGGRRLFLEAVFAFLRAILGIFSLLFLSVHHGIEQMIQFSRVPALDNGNKAESFVDTGRSQEHLSPLHHSLSAERNGDPQEHKHVRDLRHVVEHGPDTPTAPSPTQMLGSKVHEEQCHASIVSATTMPIAKALVPVTCIGISLPYNCNLSTPMPKKWYAVARGRVPGIYKTWEETEPLVKGYSGAKHKCFRTPGEAEAWMEREGVPARAAKKILLGQVGHRENCEYLGLDEYGHSVFKCVCCSEVFCNNVIEN